MLSPETTSERSSVWPRLSVIFSCTERTSTSSVTRNARSTPPVAGASSVPVRSSITGAAPASGAWTSPEGTWSGETRPGLGAASPSSVCTVPSVGSGVHIALVVAGFQAYWIAVVGVVWSLVK